MYVLVVRRIVAGLFLTALFVLSACGGGGSTTTVPSPQQQGQTIPVLSHVAIVVLENKNYSDVTGSPNMPYLMSLVPKGGVAAQYFANVHPSIGNYFAMTTGFPTPTDDGFAGILTNDNVVRVLNAAGKSWKLYAEALPSVGYLGGDVFPYLKRHAPLTYFSDVTDSPAQAAKLVPLTQLAADESAGSLPNYMFIVPNAVNSGHSCAAANPNCTAADQLAVGDKWLQANVGALLQNAEFSRSGLLVVLWDESENDNEHGGGRVFALLVGTGVKAGFTSNTFFQHESLLRLSLNALGVAQVPGGGASAPPMTEFFQ